MKPLITLVLTASVVLMLPNGAIAGVDVKPGGGEPTIVLKGTKVKRAGVQRVLPTRRITKPKKTRRLECRQGPTSAMACGQVQAPDAIDNPEGRDLTPGDILEAVRELGLPRLRVQVQPGDETLVNIETIFYTRPQEFRRSIDLLGFDIDLDAEPVQYRWVHGDGTTATTSRPGRPYPAMDVTHRYRRPADDRRPRVDVTYRVRYRVDGGAWQSLGQTLLASGPATELDVREAAPVLTKP